MELCLDFGIVWIRSRCSRRAIGLRVFLLWLWRLFGEKTAVFRRRSGFLYLIGVEKSRFLAILRIFTFGDCIVTALSLLWFRRPNIQS
jgi:hypothetical protein